MRISYVTSKGCVIRPTGEVGERMFDPKWNLMTGEGEWMTKRGRVNLSFHRFKRVIGNALVEEGAGELYRTNQRIVFVREPSYTRAMDDLFSLGLPYGVKRVRDARRLKKRGWKEFFEVPVSEMRKVKRFFACVEIALPHNLSPDDKGDIRYVIRLKPRQTAVELLGTLVE